MNKVLILEDEEYIRQFIEKVVSIHPLVNGVFAASNSKEAIVYAKEHLPSLALLDIKLSPKDSFNGIQAAKTIVTVSPNTIVVFLTGYGKYAVDSFIVHPYDYLLKPIQKEKLTEVITEILSKQNVNNKIALKVTGGTILINPNDIAFVEKQEKKTVVYSKRMEFETPYNLGEMQSVLPSNFVRVHNSFIINLFRVLMIRPTSSRNYQITFDNCAKVAWMSRKKYNENRQYFVARC